MKKVSHCIVTLMFILLVASSGMVSANSHQPNDPKGTRYIVKFVPGGASAATAALQAQGADIALELGPQNAVAAYIPEHAVQGLSNNPNIEYIELDPPRYPLAETVPYGIPMVQADLLSVSDEHAGNRMVCIIDSGYYINHEDLPSGSSVTGTNNTGSDGEWWLDKCGHGTHVAGTIAALANDRGVVGVSSGGGTNLHIVKVFGDDNVGNCAWTYSSDLINAANACQGAGANVISMSLGCSGGPGGGPLSCKNKTEEAAFNQFYNDGILSVAAAGNDGTTNKSYPASYDSVVSVAAIDSSKNIASFSQQNNQVELAAPGVDVLSTVPSYDVNTLTVGSAVYNGNHIDLSARGLAGPGDLVDGGLCDSTGSWAGMVVLCERGDISFYDKVMNVQNSLGVAAVIYNNAPGNFLGTLGDGNSSTIPAISLSQEDGQYLVTNELGVLGTVDSSLTSTPASGYQAWSGTSMATPHVSGVAALVWSYNPGWTNQQIRDALDQTAEDLGNSGRDNAYGYGLVQAQAALEYLNGSGPDNQPTALFSYSCDPETKVCDFDGTGSTGSIYTYNWDFGDGNTASGATTSNNYSADGDGTYPVTLTVMDDVGASDSITQSVFVGAKPDMYVTIDWKQQGPNLNVTVTARAATSGNPPVSGAELSSGSVSLCLGTSQCWFDTTAAITDSNGQTNFKLLHAPDGNYVFTVYNIIHPDYNYNPDHPLNESPSIFP